MERLNNCEAEEVIHTAVFFRIFGEMPSGPLDFDVSKFASSSKTVSSSHASSSGNSPRLVWRLLSDQSLRGALKD